MPGAVRLSDVCTGHGCWPARVNDTASGDVYANSRGAHRTGDHWVTHCCTVPPFPCHDGSQATGSPNVFVNGRAWSRIGDSISCGSNNATGSANVVING